MPSPDITIIVPTHNRAGTLPRLLDSIVHQTYTSWECIVVDDGSEDGTVDLVNRYAEELGDRLTLLGQRHSGKPVAINRGVRAARGNFVLTIDSDDMLVADGLEKMRAAWDAIPEDRRGEYAGVEGLCRRMDTGDAVTVVPPVAYRDVDYITSRYVVGAKGDRARLTRTDMLRSVEYPMFEGEWWMPTGFLWHRLGQHRIKFIVDHVISKDYRPDGITATKSRVRLENPNGSAHHYRLVASQLTGYPEVPISELVRVYSNWIRHLIHAGVSPLTVWPLAHRRWLLAIALPLGAGAAMRDRLVVAQSRKKPAAGLRGRST